MAAKSTKSTAYSFNRQQCQMDEGWTEEEAEKGNAKKANEESKTVSEKSSDSNNSDNQGSPLEDQLPETLEVQPASSKRIKNNSQSSYPLIGLKVQKKSDKRSSPRITPSPRDEEESVSNSGQSEMISSLRRRRVSNLDEYAEVETSETEESDGRRRNHRRKGVITSRSGTPEIPGMELNGSPSPVSSQQLLQTLPYFHLLPQAIRNDAARLLFMPPTVPSDIGGTSVTPGQTLHATSSATIDKTGSSFENSRSGPAYVCKPCNIKFSSARTLEAHQTYYCSFRRDLGNESSKGAEGDDDSKAESIPNTFKGGKKRDRESEDEVRDRVVDESMETSETGRASQESSELHANKISKTGKLYSCMYCSYSADKKVSLNRHMRMHSGPPLSSIQMSTNSNDETTLGRDSTNPTVQTPGSNIGMNKNLPEGVNALERYCQDCDIQFSSLKTFRVHKQYYCRTRHVLKPQQEATGSSTPIPIPVKGQSGVELGSGITVTSVRKNSGSPNPSEGSPLSTPGPISSQPFVVLPTSPIIIVPYYYIQAASILPGNVIPSHNALVVLPNGSVQGLPYSSAPMPAPSPSPGSQLDGMAPYIQSPFSSNSSSYKNDRTGNSSIPLGTNISPNSQAHLVFNDPKDILRKISNVSKPSSQNSLSPESTDGIGRKSISPSTNPNNPNIQVENESLSYKEKKSTGSDENTDAGSNQNGGPEIERENDENMPAIDLTLRRTYVKKEMVGDEEKENRDVFYRSRNHSEDQSQELLMAGETNNGRRLPPEGSFVDFQPEGELISSPSERQSVGSGSCGKRTPRPSSTSISSSCSTPPALCEPKVNGMITRLSSSLLDHEGTTSSNKSSSAMAMGLHPSMNLTDMRYKKGAVDFSLMGTGKHQEGRNSVGEIRGRRGKMSPMSTQLPGGAILTTATATQSINNLLLSASPDISESLAKLNPQLLMNARSASGSPLGINPVLLQALSQADPEVLMKMFDPVYLSNLQQSIQQQQHQQHHQQNQQIPMKRGYSKCIECDIVFYKHENYLVHKEHYCAARVSSSSPKSSSEKDVQLNRGGKDQSRISSCSSPARSDMDPDECVSLPVSLSLRKASINSQIGIRAPRKSTDSNSSEIIQHSVFEVPAKSKSRSPQSFQSSAVSISPIPSPKENNKDRQAVGSSQHPCLQCGVKYSTADNLKAHQSFYCTKKRNKPDASQPNSECDEVAGVKVEDAREMGHNLQGGTMSNKGLLRCSKCKLAIPEDQLNSHSRVCLGSNGSLQPGSNPVPLLGPGGGEGRGVGWKCPCCDTYSPTVSAAQKHLEVHTGIRAFKCLLCGYRGNTLRGMRTHIRTHFDKRVSDLLEGEYMTCITANDLEQNVTTTPIPPSNKSYSSLSETRTLELNHRNDTVNRMGTEGSKLNHSSNTANVVSTSSASPNLPEQSTPDEIPDVKVFALAGTGGSVTDMEKLENNNQLCYCSLCNYSSSYKGNVIRHMKAVHKIPEDAADTILTELSSKGRANKVDGIEIGILEVTKSSVLGNATKGVSSIAVSPGFLTKDEQGQEESTSFKNSLNGTGNDQTVEPGESCNQESTRSVLPPSSITAAVEDEDRGTLSSVQKKEKPCAVKYCKSCDIYFNQLSTFNAHKKAYCCSGLGNEATERAETPVQ